MGAIHLIAAAAGGSAAGMRGRRRGPSPARKAELDREFAGKGAHCFVCGRHIVKTVEGGSGWADGFYVGCRKCGTRGFRYAHNTCVPLGLGDGIIETIARWLDKNIQIIEGTPTLLVDQCGRCQGVALTSEQIDIALTHHYWEVRLACVENQSLTEAQIAKALCDGTPAIVEAAEERQAAQVVD